MADDGNVIDLRARLADDGPPLTWKRTGHCRHAKVAVDETLRQVECRACGAVLDPVEVLLQYAKAERRFHVNRKELRQKRDQLRTEVDELLRQERNAKARLRRAQKEVDRG